MSNGWMDQRWISYDQISIGCIVGAVRTRLVTAGAVMAASVTAGAVTAASVTAGVFIAASVTAGAVTARRRARDDRVRVAWRRRVHPTAVPPSVMQAMVRAHATARPGPVSHASHGPGPARPARGRAGHLGQGGGGGAGVANEIVTRRLEGRGRGGKGGRGGSSRY
jgi:hypothetical protein